MDWPLVFAVDGSTWDRCDAECSPNAGFYYSASKHSAGQPIVAGWCYQWICQLNWAPDSWTAPLDVRRIPPPADMTTATVEQVRRLVDGLGDVAEVPLFVFDAGYDPIAIGHDLAEMRCEVLCRIRDDRVFYADAAAATQPTTGHRWTSTTTRPHVPVLTADNVARTRRHARPPTIPATAPSPSTPGTDCIPDLLCRGHWASYDRPPIVRGTVIRVEVEHLPKLTARAHKTLWLWWSGPGRPDLDRCWRAYLRRFDIEHTFRFAKNTLGWTTPSLCTPDQADRWTALVVAALTQLRLARGLVQDLRLPWERPLDPAKLTPARVRRGFRRLRAHLGTPANPPKPSRAGPGRPKGTRTGPRPRHPAIKKAA